MTPGRRWSRRRRRLAASVGLLAVIALLVPATVVRTQQHEASDLDAAAHVGPHSRTDHVTVDEHTYVRGRTGLVVVDHESASARTNPLPGRSTEVDVLVGEDGDVLTVAGAQARLRPADGDGGWEFAASGEDDDALQPLALAGDTALLQRGCADGDCEVIGVREGEVAWRTKVDAAVTVQAPGDGYLNLESDPALVRAPTVAAASTDGRVVTVDAQGRVTRTSEQAEEGTSVAVVRDTVHAVDRPRGHRATITGKMLYTFDRRASGEASPDEVVAVDLDSGDSTPFPDTPGDLGMGPTALVSGEEATYRARDAESGRTLWTTELPFAVPDDRPRGTGLASASTDTAAVWSSPTTTWQVLTLSRATDRVTLLDLGSGEVLQRWVGDTPVQDVIALPGHRALLVDDEGRISLLTG